MDSVQPYQLKADEVSVAEASFAGADAAWASADPGVTDLPKLVDGAAGGVLAVEESVSVGADDILVWLEIRLNYHRAKALSSFEVAYGLN